MDLKQSGKELNALYMQRERVMPLSHRAVALCAAAIRQVHVGNLGAAKAGAKEAAELISQIRKAAAKEPRLASFLAVPYQEYAELRILVAMAGNGKPPALDVPADAYLLGALDAIGELKRVCMELLVKGRRDEALALFERMEALYYSMEGLSFPNSLVSGFKHKQDAMKAVLVRLHETLCEARMRA